MRPMSGMENVYTKFSKLNSSNFYGWSQNMEVLLTQQKLKKFIEFQNFDNWYIHSYIKSDHELGYLRKKDAILSGNEDQNTKDILIEQLDDKYFQDLSFWSREKSKLRSNWDSDQEVTQGYLRGAIETTLWSQIRDLGSAYEMWVKLKEMCLTAEVGNLIILYKEFFELTLKKDEQLISFLSRVQNILDRLIDLGEDLTPALVCYKVLSSLGDKYNALTQGLFQVPKQSLNMDLLRQKFALEDSRMKVTAMSTNNNTNGREKVSVPANSADTASSTEFKKCRKCKNLLPKSHKFPLCNHCYKGNDNARNNNNNNKEAEKEKVAKKEKDKDNKSTQGEAKASVCVMASAATAESSSWYIDSGCGAHMTNDLRELNKSQTTNFKIIGPFGTSSSSAGKMGEVNIPVKIEDRDCHVSLSQVLYSRELNKKLMSVSKLTERGALVFFEDNYCKVINKESGEVVLRAEIDNTGLYRVCDIIEDNEVAVCSVTINTTIKELHDLYGHISCDKIRNMYKEGLLSNYNITNLKDNIVCKVCDETKLARTKFTISKDRVVTKVGEVLHSDVCGPINVSSLGKNKYFITYTDHFTDYTYIKTIAHKSEALSQFINIVNIIKTQCDGSVKLLVHDGGGEYTSSEFVRYREDNGIISECTPPYTPQRNGKSERLNRTLLGMVRAMLKAKRCPKYLWGECVVYATLLRNSTNVDGKAITRFEEFWQKKPPLKLLKVFGTPVLFSNNLDSKKKLDDKALRGIFVGVNISDYTYRIYDIESRKIISSRDVKFYNHELNKYDDDDQSIFIENDDDKDIIDNHITEGYDSDDGDECKNSSEDNDMIVNDEIDIFIDKMDDEDDSDEDTSLIHPHNILYHHPQPQLQQPQHQPRHELQRPQREGRDITISRHSTRSQGVVGEKGGPSRDFWKERMEARGYSAVIENITMINEPKSVDEAITSPDSSQWREAMDSELNSLKSMSTWREVTGGDKVKSVVSSKWIYKVKYNESGVPERYKARLVARGFTQREGIDYDDTFAPTLKAEALRYLLSYTCEMGYECHHIDVETAFLNGDLEEEVYIRLPKQCGEESGKVVRLIKPLYGLKQSPRCWNKKFVSRILGIGFIQSKADPCIFYKLEEDKSITIIAIFVDDGLVIGKEESVIKYKSLLMEEFKSRDLGPVSHILGVKVERNNDKLMMSQESFITKLLEVNGMKDCKPISTPLPTKIERDNKEALTPYSDITNYQSMVGSLIYLSNTTRPDIAFTVHILAKKMVRPSVYDVVLVKRVFRYLQGTKDLALVYQGKSKVVGYSDASYAEDVIDRKSVTGLVYIMNGGAILWKSKRQPIVSLSSTEAEYIALTSTMKEGVWLAKLDAELRQKESIVEIYEDNQSTIALASNHIHNDRSKHIDVRYHYIRDMVEKGKVKIHYIQTKQQTADVLTKGLSPPLHQVHVRGLGLRSGSPTSSSSII